MTVLDMMEILETQNPEAEIEIQLQPSYPLKALVAGCVSAEEMDAACCVKGEDCGCSQCDPTHPPLANVVYIVQGNQTGYGDKEAWEAL